MKMNASLNLQEINVLCLVAVNEPISANLVVDKKSIKKLINRGLVESIKQTIENIERYKTTFDGRIKYRSLTL